jgi:DNA-binding NtrC family response regulator
LPEDELEKIMLSILLVGKDPHALAYFAAELSKKEGITVRRAASVKEAWRILGNSRVDVVVTDEELADGAALPFVHELTKQQPLINCAMVSTLSPKDFHEATEGLGVFMQLPVDPGAEEAAKLMQLLESIDALMSM